MEWKKLEHNDVLKGDGFYISYNPGVGGALMDTLGSMAALVSGDTDFMKRQEETALYDERGGIWYILNGDYRKEYGEAYKGGLARCLEVYEKYKADFRSVWSTDNLD